ncbi:MAG TPA: succinylglutamate desuccinylase/aspartoacylase family protein [Oligoflexia bacterium]|nr:succinylglutamate desuccinylase/aspartoacylase family protein [Oligoflexia bacterium]HMR25079.1 succinylglutamate desuccinylase/aspartoacylase family protein [Oligoflexia bacterium]
MSSIKVIKTKEDLKIASLKRGEIHRLHIQLSDNALGVPWRVPVIILRGQDKGPTLGITAALHGDELNGISTIFKLTEKIDPKKLSGTLVMVPISNTPGYLMNQRYFSDNQDLNRIMPGKAVGKTSQLYAHYFIKKLVSKFDYLLDLHTASYGRVNSLYIRADLENDACRTLAYLQNPHIIVQKYDVEGTLRAWANENNIPSITIEIGNPNAFQHNLIDETLEGILNTMRHLHMIEGKVKDMIHESTICDNSFWIYSTRGGIVDVLPNLTDEIKAGQVIAHVYNVFGEIKEKVTTNKSGIVIGKNVIPNCDAGSRLLHIGVDYIKPKANNIPGNNAYISGT